MNWVSTDRSVAPQHNYLSVVPWVQCTLEDGLIITRFINGKDVIADPTSVFKWLICLKAQRVPVLSIRVVNVIFFPPKTQWNFVIDVFDAIEFWEAILAQGIYNGLKNLVLVTLQRQFLYVLYNCKCPWRPFNSLQSSSLDFIKMNSNPKVKFLLQIKMKSIMF